MHTPCTPGYEIFFDATACDQLGLNARNMVRDQTGSNNKEEKSFTKKKKN